MMDPQPGMLFVIAEAGSRWPSWLANYQRVVPDVAVVASDADATPAELALRALKRLQTIESHGSRVRMAVVLAGPGEPPDEVFQARCLVASAVLKHMAGDNQGKLAFAASDSTLPEARHELLALVGTLTNQLVGTALSISVRFEPVKAAAGSGVRARAGLVEVA